MMSNLDSVIQNFQANAIHDDERAVIIGLDVWMSEPSSKPSRLLKLFAVCQLVYPKRRSGCNAISGAAVN